MFIVTRCHPDNQGDSPTSNVVVMKRLLSNSRQQSISHTVLLNLINKLIWCQSVGQRLAQRVTEKMLVLLHELLLRWKEKPSLSKASHWIRSHVHYSTRNMMKKGDIDYRLQALRSWTGLEKNLLNRFIGPSVLAKNLLFSCNTSWLGRNRFSVASSVCNINILFRSVLIVHIYGFIIKVLKVQLWLLL